MEIFSSYTGTDFLVFYCAMLATCVLAGIWIAAFLRESGTRGRVEDLEEVAVLSGGSQRHASAVLSSLFSKDAVDQAGRHKLRITRTEVGEGEAERAVLRKVGDFTLGEARKTLQSQAERVEERLIRRGLMLSKDARTHLRVISIVPYIVLFAIGLYRQQAGDALGEPTGLLIGLLCLTAFFAFLRFVKFNPRTMAGNAALRELEKEGSRLKRAPRANEAGYAVALFGTAVLVGTPWEPLHAVQRAGSGDSGSSGDGDGDGGGCGGGCGGCGG